MSHGGFVHLRNRRTGLWNSGRRARGKAGAVISPLLANLFLHYVFDLWMQRTFPSVRFERYADDAIVHCGSERQARAVPEAIRGRFEQCGLGLHPVKTRIVYCKVSDRPGDFELGVVPEVRG